MKKHVFLFLILFMLPFLHSCKKEQPEPSLQEIITKDPWHYYKVEHYDINGNIIDSNPRNGKWIFVSSGDYFLYDDNDDLYEYGTWKIENDWPNESNKLLVFDVTESNIHQYSPYALEIDKLNDDKLILATLIQVEGLHGNDNSAKLYFKR